MSILAIGLNHKTAPVDIREKVTFGPDIIAGALRSLQENPAVEETVILSTCNRTELYCTISQEDHEPLADWISRFHGLAGDRVNPYLYSHFGMDAVKHLLRVSCGLDSLVLGEPQILGQVKVAYQTATDAGTTGKLLFKLFQHAFSAAKQIRTDTAIGNSPVSVAFAAVSLAKQIFSNLSEQTALLIGAGETIELAARHLNQHGVGRIIVANRTVEKAHALAAQFDGYAIALTELSSHLSEADIVISSTASPLPVLGKGTVESALKERKHRPIFMVDIAVPRDIEPEVSDLSDIYLYTVDDLDEVIQENMRSREEAAEQAEEIIDHYVGEYMGWLRSLDAVELIQDYRSYAEQLRDEVLQKALQQLAKGKPADEVIQFMARTLTNKLLHTPSAQMRQAGFNGQMELLEAANTLFQLKKTDNKS
ncbi:MAG: glutamyl-tRNA reductase [Candidatus Thiodiazotropha sp. (ex Lucinoma annulata)]|nr:glutamyl-tRNA reductase [Candidatus Thiodiazotropha sp. (ex Lucinoma borealis)]MCU7839591.1 glutamyl-tRNA reductase [Candidatus Thiodiazotropha sp. (ex Troendleina suluensis)]MCU7883395.1 glutamyl-tRNA reductase [Candidatus Thiodiazotropha sp. (ex Lucinoma annulata)]MCU7947822.1 glutamyl-tRNA reductase [Candidatus Thiodiazotropha sp. (ex Cardiolucina cf. quadrata)]MCU7865759.1 glutamyl-tRNA reductase [Candidatus Thiodiazotropha sp. (ex Lucinoma borealis)]